MFSEHSFLEVIEEIYRVFIEDFFYKSEFFVEYLFFIKKLLVWTLRYPDLDWTRIGSGLDPDSRKRFYIFT
jgi:hypothetical protein